MTPAEALALIEGGALELHQEIEVEHADGAPVTGRLADIGTRHLWLSGHDHEDTHHARPWRTRLSAVTAVHRVVDRRWWWEPRSVKVWPAPLPPPTPGGG